MDIQGKKVLVYGAGRSGIAAVGLLATTNTSIVLFDGNKDTDVEQLKKQLPRDVEVGILVGEIPDRVRKTIEVVVVSPGVPTDLPDLIRFADDGIPVIGEIELAYMFSKGSIIAVTGTNGKTTTTSLIGQILKEYFKSSFVVGNIGIPYTLMVSKTKSNSVTVAEVSSFQLETIKEFMPNVSLILNITPDHLNRHHTMENYINAKLSITKNQGETETCILNYEDETLRTRASEINAKVQYFSSKNRIRNGIYLDGDKIIYNDGTRDVEVCKTGELNLLGVHNYENVMAAVLATIAIGVPLDVIVKVIKELL